MARGLPPTCTEADIETLKNLWARGDSGKQISRALDGRHTSSGVIGKANRMKLDARDTTINRSWAHRTKPYVYKSSKPKAPLPAPEPSIEPEPLGPPGELSDGCRWPHGDTSTQDFRFCGHPQEGTRAYCSHHVQRAYVRPYPVKK